MGVWAAAAGKKSLNREDVIEHVIEADPVAERLRSFIQEQPNKRWEGRACELLDALTDNGRNKPRQFPNSTHTLSGRLRRISTFPRKLGIEVERDKDRRTGRRIIFIRSVGDKKEASEAYGASNPVGIDRFASSTEAPEASNSSVVGDEKELSPVLSCRFEGNISIQPETLYDGEGLLSLQGTIHTRGIRWNWWEKLKRVFTCISRQ